MKPLAVMNVIPFIDIMLVLLAIVLTTSTFLAQGKIPLRLPAASKAEPVQPLDTLELSIDESGKTYINRTPVNAETLPAALGAIPPATPVRLRVDKRADFEFFVNVIDALKASGLNNLSIVTSKAGA